MHPKEKLGTLSTLTTSGVERAPVKVPSTATAIVILHDAREYSFFGFHEFGDLWSQPLCNRTQKLLKGLLQPLFELLSVSAVELRRRVQVKLLKECEGFRGPGRIHRWLFWRHSFSESRPIVPVGQKSIFCSLVPIV